MLLISTLFTCRVKGAHVAFTASTVPWLRCHSCMGGFQMVRWPFYNPALRTLVAMSAFSRLVIYITVTICWNRIMWFILLLLNEYFWLGSFLAEGNLSLFFEAFSEILFSTIFRYILSFCNTKETDILICADHAWFLQLAQSFDNFLFRFLFFIFLLNVVFLDILIEVLFRPLSVWIIELSAVHFEEQLFLKVLRCAILSYMLRCFRLHF